MKRRRRRKSVIEQQAVAAPFWGERLTYSLKDALLAALLNPRPLNARIFLYFWALLNSDLLDDEKVAEMLAYLDAPVSFCVHCDDLAEHTSANCVLPIVNG